MDFSGKRVFVTGGAGFIGSHIVEGLVQGGATVLVFDDFSSGLAENLKQVEAEVRMVKGDVRDAERLARAMREFKPDWVSHQAAQLEITHCMDDPIDDLTTNTIGTLNVLAAAVKVGVEKFLNASSACVYGQAEYTPSDEDNHPTNPNWSYGAAKLAAEKYCRIFSEMYGFPTVSFRYSIVYGPREWYGRVLTIFLKRILRGMPPVVFGEGNQERDFVYVGDVVRLHNLCFVKPAADNLVFNASTGIATTIRELAQECREAAGADIEILTEDVEVGGRSALVDGRQRLPSELQQMVLAPGKAQKLLGWQPEMTLKQGLAQELAWLEENSHRWVKMSY